MTLSSCYVNLFQTYKTAIRINSRNGARPRPGKCRPAAPEPSRGEYFSGFVFGDRTDSRPLILAADHLGLPICTTHVFAKYFFTLSGPPILRLRAGSLWS